MYTVDLGILSRFLTLREGADNGEGYACVGQEAHGKSLYLPFSFAENQKCSKE
jgi:hypothetical protein